MNFDLEKVSRDVTVDLAQSLPSIKEIFDLSGKVAIVTGAAFNCEPPFGFMNHYAAAKGGVVNYTKLCARELKPFGINMNCVCPGSMLTHGCFISPGM
jgi:NAD(P)-dependent dehydrogenase (short-subunit alcohol dehydrogenase family)